MLYLCIRFFDVTDGRKKSCLSMLRETKSFIKQKKKWI